MNLTIYPNTNGFSIPLNFDDWGVTKNEWSIACFYGAYEEAVLKKTLNEKDPVVIEDFWGRRIPKDEAIKIIKDSKLIDEMKEVIIGIINLSKV